VISLDKSQVCFLYIRKCWWFISLFSSLPYIQQLYTSDKCKRLQWSYDA